MQHHTAKANMQAAQAVLGLFSFCIKPLPIIQNGDERASNIFQQIVCGSLRWCWKVWEIGAYRATNMPQLDLDI